MKRKQIYALIFLNLFIFNSFSQDYESMIEKRLSNVLLGFDITVKPDKIEEEYLVQNRGESTSAPEKNTITFNKHSYISNFYVGDYNVVYFYHKDYFEKYGLYKVKMNLSFKSKKECVEEYKKLIKYFEFFGEKTIETTYRDPYDISVIEYERTIFLKQQFGNNFPRLEIDYHEESDKVTYLTINFYKSWNNSSIPGIKFFED